MYSSYFAAVGVSSTNGRISSEPKLNQVNLKEEPSSSSSWVAERQPSNFNGVMSDGPSRSLDSTNQSEKSREGSVSRPSKSVLCVKCKELGHTAEYCSVSQASGGSEINRGNKFYAGIESANHFRTGICERTSQYPSSVSNKANDMISEGTHEGQNNLGNQASVGNTKLLNSRSSVGNLPMRDIDVPALASVFAVSKKAVIPEHEFIWQ